MAFFERLDTNPTMLFQNAVGFVFYRFCQKEGSKRNYSAMISFTILTTSSMFGLLK